MTEMNMSNNKPFPQEQYNFYDISTNISNHQTFGAMEKWWKLGLQGGDENWKLPILFDMNRV